MCTTTTLARLRRLNPGIYAVLSFEARRRYGRGLEELPPPLLRELLQEKFGNRAEIFERLISGIDAGAGGRALAARPRRLAVDALSLAIV